MFDHQPKAYPATHCILFAHPLDAYRDESAFYSTKYVSVHGVPMPPSLPDVWVMLLP